MRKRNIMMIETTSPGSTHVKVELYYAMGGMNYFSGRTEQRGIYISVTPVSISKGSGYTSESYTAFSGTKQLVQEMRSFNQKRFDEFEPDKALVDELVDHVVSKNSITLKK